MKTIPFFLVAGFLGSGKTTLLKHFLNTYADNKRIVVIQNEFASANIDSKELKNTGKSFKLYEMNRGSVFCVCLISDFKNVLVELVDSYNPDAIVLEASGLADPIAIAQFLQAEELRHRLFLAHIWSIVDAEKFLQIVKVVKRVQHQVRVADIVIINKCDKGEQNISEIQTRIKELNPFADVLTSTFCTIPLKVSFDDSTHVPVAVKRADEHADYKPGERPDLGSAAIRVAKKVSRDSLESFLNSEAQKAYRIKGYVVLTNGQTVAVQSCFGDIMINPVADYSGITELIALGPGIDVHRFSENFRAL